MAINLIESLGWYGFFILSCLFLSGFSFGSIVTLSYWRKRFKFLFRQLDMLKAQQNLINQFHAGEIDTDELATKLAAFYDNSGTMH